MPFVLSTRPPLQSSADETPHPSDAGRGDGYPTSLRDIAIHVKDLKESNNHIFTQMTTLYLYPSIRSVYRWENRKATLGHVRPFRRTGNARASVLRDHDLLLLALFRITYPKATANEINVFLYKANYGSMQFRFYAASQITEAEKRIGLTRKKGSTTAYQALLPANKQKRWMFWNLPYPFGIADIRRKDMIDLDECGIELSDAERNFGKAYLGKRVNQAGLYSKTDKLNLLLAICGDDDLPLRWRDIWTGEGTTGERMIDFVKRILDQIKTLPDKDRRFCFVMDNLRSHHNTQMAAIIISAGHRLVFRAPYYPIDGPIEYVFNTIQGLLRYRNSLITDTATLKNEIDNAIVAIPTFAPYFINCGFWRP